MLYYLCLTSIWTLLQCVNYLGVAASVFPPKITHWNKCRADADLWLYELTLAQCRQECVARTDCIGAQYHRMSSKCGLLTQGSSSDLQTCVGFVFVSRQDIQEANQCGNCPTRHTCMEDTTCRITECLAPTVVLGTLVSIKGKLQVGESVQLEIDCGEDLHAITPGPIMLTCQPNGTYPTSDYCEATGNVWQSSTMYSQTAKNAIDGSTACQWSYSSTEKSYKNRWWMYDMGGLNQVDGVVVTPKTDGWFTSITVIVSRSFATLYNDGLEGIQCGKEYIGPPVGVPGIFDCEEKVARYLKIIKTSNDNNPLELCEVDIKYV